MQTGGQALQSLHAVTKLHSCSAADRVSPPFGQLITAPLPVKSADHNMRVFDER